MSLKLEPIKKGGKVPSSPSPVPSKKFSVTVNCVTIYLIPQNAKVKVRYKVVCSSSKMSESMINKLITRFIDETVKLNPEYIIKEVEVVEGTISVPVVMYKAPKT